MSELQFERLFWTLFGGGFLCGVAVLVVAFIAVHLFKLWREERRKKQRFRFTINGKDV
jgi:preprotein translocase subunit YajC